MLDSLPYLIVITTIIVAYSNIKVNNNFVSYGSMQILGRNLCLYKRTTFASLQINKATVCRCT